MTDSFEIMREMLRNLYVFIDFFSGYMYNIYRKILIFTVAL